MTKEEFEAKVRLLKWDVNNWLCTQEEKAKRFWNEHKEEIIVLAPIVIASGEKLIRDSKRRHNLKEEKYLKENYVYDRSRGCYIELRRKLSNRELLEIDRRKRNGESLIEILSTMRVMK